MPSRRPSRACVRREEGMGERGRERERERERERVERMKRKREMFVLVSLGNNVITHVSNKFVQEYVSIRYGDNQYHINRICIKTSIH